MDESGHQTSGPHLQNGNTSQSAFLDPEHESGHTGLENGLNGYERLNGSVKAVQDTYTYHRYRGLYDNSNPIRANSSGVTSREAGDASGYDNPRNVPHGYVCVLDYQDSLSAKRAVSIFGYTYPRDPIYGYVGVQDYPFPLYLKIVTNRYANPNSLIYGYVDPTDYSGSLPPPPKGFNKKAPSRTSQNKSGRTPPQTTYRRTRMLAALEPCFEKRLY